MKTEDFDKKFDDGEEDVLEHFDLAAMGHNSAQYIATVAEAMKYATIEDRKSVV